MTNRLGTETSPYLRQHRDNPVHWWPWGAEALAEAETTGKPILLSIGYAACHWCHVMAHESFEDPDIAARMNRDFVNIKIDREERPDLDAIYQQALAMMGQHGGWPLTMFLTPKGEPFWGGTYFPPTSRYGRPGFPEVLKGVLATWRDGQDRVAANVRALKAGLSERSGPGTTVELSPDLMNRAATQVLTMVDPEHGGLRGAPKFPQPGLFDFLWRAALRTGDRKLADAVTLTLDRICLGGIYDHLGGGFMRYSTDETWLVPHFEKMLYDNAQMVELLTKAWQGTREPLYAARVAETVAWLARDMMAEGGAFAATLDADSEGVEGKFYTWTVPQVEQVLPLDLATAFKAAYDVHRGGNWEGVSILHRNHAAPAQADENMLAKARTLLWQVREARIPPDRDDKVLADWNGMMVAALAFAGQVFDRPDWIALARGAYDAVRRMMVLPDDRLAHSLCQGRFRPVGLLDDLAHMARAALMLHQAQGEPQLLEHARTWVAAADRHHWDQRTGGYFQAAADADDVIVRLKPIHDNAVPSANGIMAQVLARLALVTGEDRYRRRAEAVIEAFGNEISAHFVNITALLAAFEMLAEPVTVTVVGPLDRADTKALTRAVLETAIPELVLKQDSGGDQGLVDGCAAAYVCHGFTCLAPITDPALLPTALGKR